jgi:serine protease Do
VVRCALVLGGAGFLGSTSFALNSSAGAGDQNRKPTLSIKIHETPLNRSKDLKSSVVQKVVLSVVKIFVLSFVPERSPLCGPGFDIYRYSFDDRGLGSNTPGQPDSAHERVLGSGVIVSPDDYILTNNHVVKNAKEIQVALNDGRTFSGRAIGTDPQNDIALIRVDANNLPALTLADGDKVDVGVFTASAFLIECRIVEPV